MYNDSRKSNLSKILNSRLFLLASLVILILVSFGLAKIIYRRLQIKKEIFSLDEKIQTLEKSNSNLVHLIDYLNTDTYKEESARTELGLKKPDETVVVIKDELNSNQTDMFPELVLNENKEPKLGNPQKWWNYFFKN